MKVAIDTLREHILKGLVSIGYAEPGQTEETIQGGVREVQAAVASLETEVIAESLIYAETHGHPDQGISKIFSPHLKPHPNARAITVEKAGTVMLKINGGLRSAVYVLWDASRRALGLAREYGVGIAYIRGITSSSGCLGFFAEMIACAGYEGEIIATTFPKMAPAGGVYPALGINTIAYGFPGHDSQPPRVIDLTTAAMPLMQLMNYKGKLADDVGYDKDGRETNNPASIVNGGTLRAFGDGRSPKGAILATVLQVKGQVIAGAQGETPDWGARIQVTALPNIPDYESRFRELESRIMQSGPTWMRPKIRFPGSAGSEFAQESERTGMVDVDESTFQQLVSLIEASQA